MTLQLAIGLIVLAAVALGIIIEVGRLRSQSRKRRRTSTGPAVRSPQLEQRMVAAFAGPRKVFGDCFAEFAIYRQADTTRLTLSTKGSWAAIDVFNRSLIVRHIWRALQSLTKTSVVVAVDTGGPGAMLWNAAATAAFNDRGILDPWAPAKGKAGTLISG